MTAPTRLSIGSQVTVDIDDLALGGDGVGRVDGKVVFVAGALPGERVRARIVDDRRHFARATTEDVERASADRRAADCRHEIEGGCGGCGLRHVVTSRALELRAGAALGELGKLSGGLDWPTPTLHVDPEPDEARHRVRFHVANWRLGLYRRGTHELVRIPDCSAAHPGILDAAALVERALTSEKADSRLDSVLVEWAAERPWATLAGRVDQRLERAFTELVEAGSLAAVCIDPGRRAGGPRVVGAPWIAEPTRIGGRELAYLRRPGTFAQTNPRANEQLRERLHGILTVVAPGAVLDLYAGSGNLSLVAGLSARRVVGVEVDSRALDGLAASVEASSDTLAGTSFEARRRDLTRGLSRSLAGLEVDAVVLDPPRSGAKAVMGGLLALDAPHVLYVSCSPAHLARDAARLDGRYDVVSLDAFDMFPRTPHVELLAHLRRR